MLVTVGIIRKTLAAAGLAALAAALAPPAMSAERLAASDGVPSAPEGPFARNFTFSDPPVPAPSESFQTLEGETVALDDFRGRVVLVNFWATWCAPCIEEMPSLERLHQALEDEGFAVLAVSNDRGGSAAVMPFLDRVNLHFLPIYLDSKGVLARAFGLTGLPTTFLIGRDGRILAELVGPAEWDSPAALDFIRHYLGDGADLTETSG